MRSQKLYLWKLITSKSQCSTAALIKMVNRYALSKSLMFYDASASPLHNDS